MAAQRATRRSRSRDSVTLPPRRRGDAEAPSSKQMEPSERIILEFRPKEGADFFQFVLDYSNGRLVDLSAYDIYHHTSIVDSFRDEFVDYIAQHGLTSLMRRQPVFEALVPRHCPPDQIGALVKRFLQEIAVSEELIIIDPYFLPHRADANYASLVESMLDPVLGSLTSLRLITGPKFDPSLRSSVSSRLQGRNPALAVHHVATEVFHDRFWIDRYAMKGFVMGTSLNGLGGKYALIDRLQQSDVRDIVNALTHESLL